MKFSLSDKSEKNFATIKLEELGLDNQRKLDGLLESNIF